MITLTEIPYVCTFAFVASDKNAYKIVCGKRMKGFEVIIWLNNQVVHKYNIDWEIPPDYQAAKELIEIFLKNQ